MKLVEAIEAEMTRKKAPALVINKIVKFLNEVTGRFGQMELTEEQQQLLTEFADDPEEVLDALEDGLSRAGGFRIPSFFMRKLRRLPPVNTIERLDGTVVEMEP